MLYGRQTNGSTISYQSPMLYIFLTVIYIFTRYKRRIILLLVRLRYSCSGTRSLLSVVYLFLSLTGGTPRRLVRHHRSGVQKNSCLIEVYTFQVIVRFLCSDNVSRRCSCSGTIGALSGVVLLFLNARPVVSDERNEEFRRSVIEKARRPTEATGSPNTNTEDE